jgi:hypothetical protein
MKFTMGRKIGLGFFIVLSLTIIVGTTGYFAMKRVVSMADMNRQLTGMWGGFAAIKEQANIYPVVAKVGGLQSLPLKTSGIKRRKG